VTLSGLRILEHEHILLPVEEAAFQIAAMRDYSWLGFVTRTSITTNDSRRLVQPPSQAL
jgi:hypothetical protein